MNIKVDKKYINIYKLFFDKLKDYGWTGNYKYELFDNNNKNLINIKINTYGNKDEDDDDLGIVINLEQYLNKYKFMDYNLVEEMIVYLGSQLSILHKHGLGFLFFNLKDISIIDGKYFIFNSFDELCVINNNVNKKVRHDEIKVRYDEIKDNDDQLICNFPIHKNNKFIAPELKDNQSLPIITNITSSYYSFGLLCVRCLEIDLSLDAIYNTRIYYFLKRCLENDPSKRYFIYL